MQLWTPEHTRTLLPATVVFLVVALILRLTIGKKELNIRMIPLQILALVIVLLEIGKQTMSFIKGYDLYHIPLHYCSMLIFAMPAMAFYKGKHCEIVKAVGAALCTAMTLLTLIYPNLIYSPGNVNDYFKGFFDFHTVTFHNVVILATFLTIALDLHTVQPKGEVKATTLVVCVFCVVSATMAQVLKTNFANYYSCNIAPLEAVRVSVQGALGTAVAQLLYILIVSALNILFTLLSYWAFRGLSKLFRRKTPVKTV